MGANHVENTICFCSIRREIPHIRLQSRWKWSEFTVEVKGAIKGFQSIRLGFWKESTFASCKAIKGSVRRD